MSQGYATTLSAVQFTGCTINPAQIANANAWIGTDSATTVGITYNVPTSTTNGHQFTVNGALGFQVGKTGAATASVFMAASQSTAGLLVSGAASITGNIFEIDLTSGGTLALALTSAGALEFGNLGGSTLPNAPSISGGSAGSLLLNAKAGQTIIFNTGASGANTLATLTAANGLVIPAIASESSVYVGSSQFGYSGVGAFAAGTRGATAVALSYANNGTVSGATDLGSMANVIGTSGVNGTVFQFNYNGTPYSGQGTSGNMGIAGTGYSTSSSKSTKTNIGPLNCDPIADLRATTIVSYQALLEIEALGVEAPTRIGPIAENLPTSMREGVGGFNLSAAISILLAAGKIVEARVTALEGKNAAAAG